MKKICVIGTGTMGSGIAQVSAQAGFETWMIDVKPELLDRGMTIIKTSLGRLVKKGTLSQDDEGRVLTALHTSTNMREVVKDADFVIEAVFEKAEVKLSVFKELDEACPQEVILGSNTSTIPIALLSSATSRADKVIGTHFMNPVPVMRGVEVIKALLTSEETVGVTLDLMKSFGKEAVVIKDSPGFVTNRLCMLVLNEGAKTLGENLGSIEDIDRVMRLSFNWPMGPFELSDLIGIDVVVDALEAIYKETGWE